MNLKNIANAITQVLSSALALLIYNKQTFGASVIEPKLAIVCRSRTLANACTQVHWLSEPKLT